MEHIDFTERHRCPVSGGMGQEVIDLPRYPITEIFLPWQKGLADDGFLDQTLVLSEEVSHLYLRRTLDVRVIYERYETLSGASQGAVEGLAAFKAFMERHAALEEFGVMIDIGGNDSTFLDQFKGAIPELHNFDPNAKGGDHIHVNRQFIEDIDLSAYRTGPKKIISSSHTIEHLDRPDEFVQEIADNMTADDLCFLQFPSLEKLVRYARFDQICHQHLHLFSLASIDRILRDRGLTILDYEYDDAIFGTLRLVARKGVTRTAEEVTAGFVPVTAKEIAARYESFRAVYRHTNDLIAPEFEGGIGFGAGLLVPTLAYHLPAVNALSTILDDNPAKRGKRFINLPPLIRESREEDMDGPILITSVSTKQAARAIFAKLKEAGAKHVVLPMVFN